MGIPGADLQLRAGGTPVLADLHTVATSTGAGGTVQLSLTSPVHARCLLIWFTKLPPGASGTTRSACTGSVSKVGRDCGARSGFTIEK